MTVTATTQIPSDCISSDRVEGSSVYGTDGKKLGTIHDLIIDKRSGQVQYAVLEFGGFLGMGTDRYPLPWSTLKFDTDKDGYIVPLQKEHLEKAPRYPETEIPEYTPEYTRRVHEYWGSIGMY